ncbi:MAG: VCBS repeat-containing protein [Anaerolineales bacterium]|nr:VCBS repeat-containing protein [Anaerolineales bacterium]
MARFTCLLLGLLMAAAPRATAAPQAPGGQTTLYLPVIALGPRAPVLKWAYGGCQGIYCETGWYSSPAVADIDGDGAAEVVGAAYSVTALTGETGAQEWRVDPPGDRSWPGVVIADLNDDNAPEIITAHGGGYVHVYDATGQITLTRQPTPGSELRTLAAADLEGDGDVEIAVASTRDSDQWFVYEHDGSLRAGEWPQHGPDDLVNGYAAGAYNANVGIADLDGDGRGEIVGPSDVHYITAYEDDGAQLRANAIYGLNPDGSLKVWSRVGVHVDHVVDLRGWAYCGSEHRPNFAAAAPTLTDLDGNGAREIIVTGNVYNCVVGHPPGLYEGLFVFNLDRTRWAAGGYDWTIIPVPDGSAAPLTEDYGVIENAQPNPAAADLDGDGELEILYPSYDGRLHAYWLDRTEHGNWPFEVYEPGGGYRFASEPVIADLDGDGRAEVIFSSWSQKGTGAPGRLYVVSALGGLLHQVDLPAASAGATWNGSLAAPTLANIDGDADLEVVLNTAHSGLVAYDLPGTAAARVLWGTGRGTYFRAGTPP